MENVIDFWYESNACWGRVNSLDDLKEKALLQLAGHNSINSIDKFLDDSKQNSVRMDFGTRREHRGPKTLREYLIEISELDNFLALMGDEPVKKPMSQSMKDYFNAIESWENLSSPEYDDILLRSKTIEPFKTSNSLHIYDEQYLIDGETYQFIYAISDAEGKPDIRKKLPKTLL